MSAVSEKAKREEEKYLAERTAQWLEALTGQKLSGLGLALGPMLKNGKVLGRVASILKPSSSARGSGSASFSKADLTEERKGFQAVLDVDLGWLLVTLAPYALAKALFGKEFARHLPVLNDVGPSRLQLVNRVLGRLEGGR